MLVIANSLCRIIYDHLVQVFREPRQRRAFEFYEAVSMYLAESAEKRFFSHYRKHRLGEMAIYAGSFIE